MAEEEKRGNREIGTPKQETPPLKAQRAAPVQARLPETIVWQS
ncbi:hypothetical protein ACFQU1_12330 [Chelatococcus sp. GCM10030263]